MQIEPLSLSTLLCFNCNLITAKHKCKIKLSEDTFITVCLCADCITLDETLLCMRFIGKDVTVKQAAKFLGVNEVRVRQFIYSKRLPAQKIGRELLIKLDVLESFAEIERKTGRPENRK